MKSNDFDNLNSAIDVSMALTRPVKATAETNVILSRWPNLVESQQVISHAANYLHSIEKELLDGSSAPDASVIGQLDSTQL